MTRHSMTPFSLASLAGVAVLGSAYIVPLRANSLNGIGQSNTAAAPGGQLPPLDEAALVERYGLDRELAQQVAADLMVRSDLGFSVDPQLVIDLRSGAFPRADDVPEIPMTPEEAKVFLVRQSLTDDAQILNRYLSVGEYAGVYAGQFVDSVDGGRLVIQIAGEAGTAGVRKALDGELGALLPHRDKVVVNTVTTSRRDLVTARERLMAESEAEGTNSAINGVQIDNSSNQLVVLTSPGATESEVKRWRERLADLGVDYRVEERQPFSATAETLRSDSKTPPYYGGHGYVATNTKSDPPPAGTEGQYCTLGFSVTRGSDPGGNYMISAAHCWFDIGWQAPIDSKAFYNWDNQGGGSRTYLGSMKAYYRTSNLDLSLIAMGSQAFPKIIVHQPPNRGYRGITAVTAYAPQGTELCAIGSMSNSPHCGAVDDWDDGSHNIVANIPNVIGGDSGGPLYLIQPNLKAWATGITWGTNGSQTSSTNINAYLHAFCGDCNVSIE